MSSSSHRSSTSSDQSFKSGRSRSPSLSAHDSTAALILIHDPENLDSPFEFSDEEEDYEPLDANHRSSTSVPSLSPSTAFVYLLSPYLSLGALLLPSASSSLKYGLGSLVLFAVLSAFVRQIWYMLGRYMRTLSMDEVVVDAFARGRGKEKRRRILRVLIRFGTGFLRVVLASMYLRVAVDNLPQTTLIPHVPTRPIMTVVVALAVLPLTLASSWSAKRIVWSAWMSIAVYILWLGSVSYAHANGALEVNPHNRGLWEGITVTAFAFTSSSTLPLYASLKGSAPLTTTKTKKSHSFRIVSLLSVSTAILLMLPLAFFSASPNRPETSTLLPAPLIPTLAAVTLALRIPFLLVTAPAVPLPVSIRRSTTSAFQHGLARGLVWGLVLLFGLATSLGSAGAKFGQVLGDVGLMAALAATYLLPAVVHITTHHFKRPLSIIIPSTPLTATTSVSRGHSPISASPSASTPAPRTPFDELLQRKERALQRRRFMRRIVWDIGVWVALVPVGGGGAVWCVGRILGRW